MGYFVDISHGRAVLHVTMNDEDVDNAPVYVYSESGSYLGISGKTDGEGTVSFTIPAGGYKFRIDQRGVKYWTGVEQVIAH